MCTIYQIVNKKNNKRYIGSTDDQNNRWNTHKRLLRNGNHNNVHLQRSYNKHGKEAFEFEVIEKVSDEKQKHAKEQMYLNIYQRDDRWDELFNIVKEAGGGGAKGLNSGSKNGQAIFTEKEIVEIRGKYYLNKSTYYDLAEDYDTSHSTISDIVKGRNWENAPGPIKGIHYSNKSQKKRSYNAKFTDKQINKIRSLYSTDNYTQSQLADSFDCSQGTIYKIINHKSYKDI